MNRYLLLLLSQIVFISSPSYAATSIPSDSTASEMIRCANGQGCTDVGPDAAGIQTSIDTQYTLTPETDPRELILKARHLEFLERTHLDTLRPGADLQLTRLGHYAELDRHISLHRFVLGMEQHREVT